MSARSNPLIYREFPDGEGPARFRPVRLRSALRRETAYYALRILVDRRWQNLVTETAYESELLGLVGLEADADKLDRRDVGALRAALARQMERLKPQVRGHHDLLARNIERVGKLLGLQKNECALLRLAVVTSLVTEFGTLLELARERRRDVIGPLQVATGQCRRQLINALGDESTLKRSHLLTGCTSDEPLELRDGLADMLLSPRFDGARLLRSLVRLAPPAALSLVDFAHVHELDLVTRYMREVLARRRTGVNVLLYGEPGTGKTEFVRVLAATLGTELYEVPNSDDDDEAISGKERFQSYSICQELLGGERGRMLLFDEVEDVFGSGDWSIFSQLFGGSGRGGRDAESLRKSWINQTLESNPVPAVWVCNSIGAMDPAYLRRFDLAVEFRRLTRTARRRMIDRHFRRGEISAQCAERLAEVDALTPAALERTARVLRSLHTRSASQRDAEAEQIVTTSLRASGYHRQLPKPVLPAHYDPAFLRCDADLDGIVRGLKRGGSARLCLYGPPGTGKSAFAHHLGRELDRPVLVRRASDLLGKYIGETEKALRRAFEQARDDQAILLIDEADGFLRDRRGAERSWEVSQVNELLTQMEAFDGIFVASTNLLDMLDAAALRRFDFKLKFDAMDRAQRRAMLLRVADTADDTDAATRAACAAIERLEHVTPGDFANVLRQLRLTRDPASAARVVELLRAEVAMKPRAGRPIGFV